MKERIPKKLHQTWKNEDLSTYPLVASHAAWKKALPDFEVILWTDKQVEDLVREHYPELFPTFMGYPYPIQRADIARYVILHHEGGIYADLDCSPNIMMVSRLLDAELVLVATSQEQALSNHFMAAEKNSKILGLALREAPNNDQWIALPYLRVFSSTGPLFMTRMVRKYVESQWGGKGNNGGEEEFSAEKLDLLVLSSAAGMGFCFHRAGRSWHSLDGYLLNQLADNPYAVPILVTFLVIVCLCCIALVRSRRR